MKTYAKPGASLAALGLTGLAFALRVLALDQDSLWFDTAHSAVVALNPTVEEVLRGVASDFQSPLYFLLLHYWLKVSQTDFWLRLLTVLIGTAIVPVVYVAGKRFFTPTAGLAAALFSALTTYQVYYSRYPRAYILLALLGILAAYTLHRALADREPWLWALHGITVALTLYTHPYAFFLVPAFWGYGAWFCLTQDRGVLRPFILSSCLVIISYSPWVVITWGQWRQVQTGADAWIEPVTRDSLKTLSDWLWFKTRAEYGPLADLLLRGGRYLFSGLLLLALWRMRDRAEAWYVSSLVVLPVLLVLVFSVTLVPVWDPRYLVLLSPFFALWLGSTLSDKILPIEPGVPLLLRLRAYNTPAAVAFLVAMSLPPLSSLYFDRAFQNPDLKNSSHWVRAQYREGDVILHINYQSYLPALWYDHQAQESKRVGATAFAVPCIWESLPDTWCQRAPYRESYVNLEQQQFSEGVRGEQRVWLVVLFNHNWSDEEEKARRLVEKLRGTEFSLGRSAQFTGVHVYELLSTGNPLLVPVQGWPLDSAGGKFVS